MSFCTHCGTLTGDARFCSSCGGAVAATEGQQTPSIAEPVKAGRGSRRRVLVLAASALGLMGAVAVAASAGGGQAAVDESCVQDMLVQFPALAREDVAPMCVSNTETGDTTADSAGSVAAPPSTTVTYCGGNALSGLLQITGTLTNLGAETSSFEVHAEFVTEDGVRFADGFAWVSDVAQAGTARWTVEIPNSNAPLRYGERGMELAGECNVAGVEATEFYGE